jgi:hypothetical protein
MAAGAARDFSSGLPCAAAYNTAALTPLNLRKSLREIILYLLIKYQKIFVN